jgi:hypothetical protein
MYESDMQSLARKHQQVIICLLVSRCKHGASPEVDGCGGSV